MQQNLPIWVQPALAVILFAVFTGATVAAFLIGDNNLRIQMATGALSLATMAAGFYFGSSSGSQHKDATIAGLSPPSSNQNPPAAVTTVPPPVA